VLVLRKTGGSLNRAERKPASAFAKLGKGNAAPADHRFLLAKCVGFVVHVCLPVLHPTGALDVFVDEDGGSAIFHCKTIACSRGWWLAIKYTPSASITRDRNCPTKIAHFLNLTSGPTPFSAMNST
jgi:hypothetical protein